MKITLVRHAEVIEEYQGKYNGHIDIPLSQNGKLQAKKLAFKLKDEKFDKIYCSDLIRARETLNAFKYATKPIFSEKLREKSWGIHEGKSFDEIQKMGIKYENFEQWISDLDGESTQAYTKQVKQYFYTTILAQKSPNILIVTHSGFIKTLLSIVKNSHIKETFEVQLPYGSYIILDSSTMTFTQILI